MFITLQEIIERNWQMGQNRPVKGYLLNSTYSSSSITEEILLGNAKRVFGLKIATLIILFNFDLTKFILSIIS